MGLQKDEPDLKGSTAAFKKTPRLTSNLSTTQIDVGHGKKAIVIFVPVPLLPGFHKVQQRYASSSPKISSEPPKKKRPPQSQTNRSPQPDPRTRKEILRAPRPHPRLPPHPPSAQTLGPLAHVANPETSAFAHLDRRARRSPPRCRVPRGNRRQAYADARGRE